MKLTVEQLRKAYATAREQKTAQGEEIRRQERALAALKQEQEQAAAAGDLATYDAKAEEIRKAQSRLYVTIKSANASGRVTPEQASEAWREYAANFGKSQGAKLAAYDKKRRELCRDYEEIITGQNDAMQTAQEVAEMSGTDAGSYDLPVWIPTEYEKNAPNSYGRMAPDAEYFTSAGLWPCNFDLPDRPGAPHWAGIETADKVICQRVPVGRPDFGHK